jgi:ubiquinone/menaquinone biosynthesis C-methylase UbiE
MKSNYFQKSQKIHPEFDSINTNTNTHTDTDTDTDIDTDTDTNTDTTIVYNAIAKQFSKTRYKMWLGVRNFLKSIPESSYILDAGCGNGKNMMETNHIFYGIDYSEQLLLEAKELTKNKTNIIGLEKMSILNMSKFNENTFDSVMCIAVIHHLETTFERISAILELIRVCKSGGSILFTVWKQEDNDVYNNGIDAKTGNIGDKIILWKDKENDKIYNRFYHFFSYLEVIELIKLVEKKLFELNKSISLCKINEEANNYYVTIDLELI